MKTRIKETEKVLKVEGVYLEDGYDYGLDEVEILPEFNQGKFPIDYEQRRFELVKAAMQGFIPSRRAGVMNEQDIARLAVDQADAVLAEYRKGGEK